MNPHMLFFVYGASGSGKSTLLNMASEMSSRITIHRKDTTRKPRPLEKNKNLKDIRFMKKMNQKEYILLYNQWGNQYGIRKDLLDKAFKNRELHFIIIGNVDSIKKMKAMYPYAVTIYVHYSPEEIPKNFLERDSLEYKQRKTKIERQYKEYIENNTLFDYVIVNFWELDNARKQLKNIIKKFDPGFKFDNGK